MMKVADIMQQRYDASEAYIEQYDTMQKNAKALSKDQALLDERTKHYNEQVKALATRPDLENVTKDVAKLGRGYAQEYKNFADNMAAAQKYQEELDKWTEKDKGGDKTTANALMAMSMDQYGGMKYDPQSGKYVGKFNGIQPADIVDTAEWVKKVAGDIAASSNGSIVEKNDGLYFVKQGGKTEKLDFKRDILPRMQEAYRLDPKLQSDFNQRAAIAGWRQKGLKLADIANDPKLDLVKKEVEGLMARGASEEQAMATVFGGRTKEALENELFNFGRKYAYTKTESSFEYDGKTIEGEKEVNKEQTMFTMSTLAPGSPNVIESVGDFEAARNTTQTTHDAAMKEYSDWIAAQRLNGNSIVSAKDGRVFRVAPDGTRTEITDEANTKRAAIKQARADLNNYEIIEKAARDASGYHPETANSTAAKKVLDAAEKEYKRILAFDKNLGIDPKIAEKNAQAAKDKYIKNHRDELPGYDTYQEELKKRLNHGAESSTIITIGDPKTKELWSNNITALTQGLGLDKGALAFTIGSGKDQGKTLSADQYDELKGKVEVIGFDSDEKGNTVLKLRAFANVQGKKTEGENLVLSMGNTNMDAVLDQWAAQGKLNKADLATFRNTAYIKGQLNNPTRRAQIMIPGTNQAASIRSENGKWVVSLPQNGGTSEQLADTYEGISNILNEASSRY